MINQTYFAATIFHLERLAKKINFLKNIFQLIHHQLNDHQRSAKWPKQQQIWTN